MTRPYLPERPSPRRSAVRNRARPYSVTLSRKVAASSTLLPQAAPQRVAGLLGPTPGAPQWRRHPPPGKAPRFSALHGSPKGPWQVGATTFAH